MIKDLEKTIEEAKKAIQTTAKNKSDETLEEKLTDTSSPWYLLAQSAREESRKSKNRTGEACLLKGEKIYILEYQNTIPPVITICESTQKEKETTHVTSSTWGNIIREKEEPTSHLLWVCSTGVSPSLEKICDSQEEAIRSAEKYMNENLEWQENTTKNFKVASTTEITYIIEKVTHGKWRHQKLDAWNLKKLISKTKEKNKVKIENKTSTPIDPELDLSNVREIFKALCSETCPAGQEEKRYGALLRKLGFDKIPGGWKLDIKNGEEQSTTGFCAHLDDVTFLVKKTQLEGERIIKNTSGILGADDRAGVSILLHMIHHQVPGRYLLFEDEESGCQGSRKALGENVSSGLRQLIAFDRKGKESVITHQNFIRTCSEKYALALSKALSKETKTPWFPDSTGGVTDSNTFKEVVPECTNLSVGYSNAHSNQENQDLEHLEKLAKACLNIKWEELPCQSISEKKAEKERLLSKKTKETSPRKTEKRANHPTSLKTIHQQPKEKKNDPAKEKRAAHIHDIYDLPESNALTRSLIAINDPEGSVLLLQEVLTTSRATKEKLEEKYPLIKKLTGPKDPLVHQTNISAWLREILEMEKEDQKIKNIINTLREGGSDQGRLYHCQNFQRLYAEKPELIQNLIATLMESPEFKSIQSKKVSGETLSERINSLLKQAREENPKAFKKACEQAAKNQERDVVIQGIDKGIKALENIPSRFS